MDRDFEKIIGEIKSWCQSRGVEMQEQVLDSHKAGEFSGKLITTNRDYAAEERLYYLIHAIGSIVLWSKNKSSVQHMFDELREAKERKQDEPERLQGMIERYRSFEIESSELAVGLIMELGHSDIIPSYSNFMRADLEAMTEFHKTGRAPVWHKFFQEWNEEVAAGRRVPEPFSPKLIPPFCPVEIKKQEILQR
jgi:hypothetical protein